MIANESSTFPILNAINHAVIPNLLAVWMTVGTTGLELSAREEDLALQGGAPVQSVIDLGTTNLNGANIIDTLLNCHNFYLWLSRNVAVNVVPLMKYGRPMIAGLPEDMFDISWDNFKGEAKASINNIKKGRLELMLSTLANGWRTTNTYGGDWKSIIRQHFIEDTHQ